MFTKPHQEDAMHKAAGVTALTLLLLGGCGGGSGNGPEEPGEPPLTAATLGEQTVLSPAEYLSAAPYAEADRQRGQRQAQLCRACHSLEEGGANMIGPNLHGFFGEPIGSREGFDYSEAIREADFVWTPRALDAWLAQPATFLPGNRMTFAGVNRQADRDALIAYLLEATESE